MPDTVQASAGYILCHVHSGSRKPQQPSLHLPMGRGGCVTQPKSLQSRDMSGAGGFFVAVTRRPDGIT